MNHTSSRLPLLKPKNWLLVKSRQWHRWIGLVAGLFVLVTATSGFVLNYRKPVFTALGLEGGFLREAGKPGDNPMKSESSFTTVTGFGASSLNVERLLDMARQEWGDVPLDRIELKDERGELIYKIKRRGGDELWVNAATGSHFTKGEPGKPGPGSPGGMPGGRSDWGKLLLDLHTGRIGGGVGKAIMSCAALLLLFLVFSGIYLWAKPLLLRRRNAAGRAATAVVLRPETISPTTESCAKEAIEV